MDLAARIAQFENMVQADPENDMAHFSLGSAYAQGERYAEAAESFRRCIALNASMSKAYQLGGDALIKAGRTEEAGELLTKGYVAAATRGDLLPKNAMGAMLKQLGRPVPEVATAAPKAADAEGSFVCRRTGKPGHKMARPPFKGPVGAWIFENISRETFDQWIGQGTKVINELRLDLSRDEDNETYDRHMREYLGIDDEVLAARCVVQKWWHGQARSSEQALTPSMQRFSTAGSSRASQISKSVISEGGFTSVTPPPTPRCVATRPLRARAWTILAR